MPAKKTPAQPPKVIQEEITQETKIEDQEVVDVLDEIRSGKLWKNGENADPDEVKRISRERRLEILRRAREARSQHLEIRKAERDLALIERVKGVGGSSKKKVPRIVYESASESDLDSSSSEEVVIRKKKSSGGKKAKKPRIKSLSSDDEVQKPKKVETPSMIPYGWRR